MDLKKLNESLSSLKKSITESVDNSSLIKIGQDYAKNLGLEFDELASMDWYGDYLEIRFHLNGKRANYAMILKIENLTSRPIASFDIEGFGDDGDELGKGNGNGLSNFSDVKKFVDKIEP